MLVVTGGAGFIGSCILSRLNSLGRSDIWIVDDFEDAPRGVEQGNHRDAEGKRKNLEGKKFSRYLDKKEFLELVLQDKLDPAVNAVIHMGACSSTTLNDAEYFQENNFEYTQHLARWALRHKARFIYASSAATYGDGSQGYSDDDATTRRLKPLNLYGQSKQKFDAWALKQGVVNQMAGLKFFNVFGPNEYHKGDMRSVIAKAYHKAATKGEIELFKSYKKEYADGEQKRDFIYVKDAVDVVLFFFEHPHLGGIYNLGTGEAKSWNDLAKAIFKAVDKKPHITYFDMPPELRDKYQYFTQADMTKLRQSGYKRNFTPFEDAVADYVSYLKKNEYL